MTRLIRRLFLCTALLSAFVAGVACISADAPKRVSDLPEIRTAPEITQGEWFNSDPLTIAGLQGKVVLVEFWTYT